MTKKLCRSLGTTAPPCKYAGPTVYSPSDFTPYVQCGHPENKDNEKYKLNLKSLQDAEAKGLDINECELYEKGEEVAAEVPESLKNVKKKNYMLITGTKEQVEKLVNEKIEEGYEICGGAFVTASQIGHVAEGCTTPFTEPEFAQTVCVSIIDRR